MMKKIMIIFGILVCVMVLSAGTVFALEEDDPCPNCGEYSLLEDKFHPDGRPYTDEEQASNKHGSHTDYIDEQTCGDYYGLRCLDCGWCSAEVTLKDVIPHEFVDFYVVGEEDIKYEPCSKTEHKVITTFHCWMCGYINPEKDEYMEEHNVKNGKCVVCGSTSLAKANPLSVKGKNVKIKYNKLKKKNLTLAVSKVLTIKNKGVGKLGYSGYCSNKKITVNDKTGKVTLKKGLKKGTYKLEYCITAGGNKDYFGALKYVDVKIVVK